MAQMILNYITLFSAGEGSEALVIDRFERTDDLIIWESREQYVEARKDEPKIIDGGIFSYGLVTGTASIPDALIANHIVSFLAPSSVHALLDVLHAVVRAMRSAEWPTWPDQR